MVKKHALCQFKVLMRVLLTLLLQAAIKARLTCKSRNRKTPNTCVSYSGAKHFSGWKHVLGKSCFFLHAIMPEFLVVECEWLYTSWPIHFSCI